MSNNYKSAHVYHVGETATEFGAYITVDGVIPRQDVASCKFRLVKADDPSVILIGPTSARVDCQTVDNDTGWCGYKPSRAEMLALAQHCSYGAPLRAVGQLWPIYADDDGTTAHEDDQPLCYIEYVIESNL